MEVYWIVIFFVVGCTLGSFFNVVGLRVPRRISFIHDRSFCPHCNEQLQWFELIPILSYVLQLGRCKTCDHKIRFIYPLVEWMTGGLFAFSYVQLGFQLELVVILFFISLLNIVFVSDITYMIIPNKVLLFFLPLFILFRIISPLQPWYSAWVGLMIGFGLIAFIIIGSKGGMGAGDMKLFALQGIILGVEKTLLTFFLATLFGAIIGILLLSMKVISKRHPVPFGPYLIIASIISYFYGSEMITYYLELFER